MFNIRLSFNSLSYELLDITVAQTVTQAVTKVTVVAALTRLTQIQIITTLIRRKMVATVVAVAGVTTAIQRKRMTRITLTLTMIVGEAARRGMANRWVRCIQ